MALTANLTHLEHQALSPNCINLSRALRSKFPSSSLLRALDYAASCESKIKRSVALNLSFILRRGLKSASSANSETFSSDMAGHLPFMQNVLAAFVKPYLEKNPTAVAALELVRAKNEGPLSYDHFAFRTFGVDGVGIESIAQLFVDMGFVRRDELHFPEKKLRAFWYSPPETFVDLEGDGVYGAWPRIFISELLVDQLSSEAQQIIKTYTMQASALAQHAALAGVLNSLPWPIPSSADYCRLARESEYAAWTLVNGYSLNHLTISVHRLKGELQKIRKLNELLVDHKIRLNSEGGTLKVSPDGGLQQSSSVADLLPYSFADGVTQQVPASYIEFAERLVLAQYQHLPSDQVYERHRRDGFEVGNADKIFASTFADQVATNGD